jgi:hypothetical protein
VIIFGDGYQPELWMRRLKRLIWKRMSADSDGSPSGGRRFGSRQSRVPGVEANHTEILRSSHRRRPVRAYNSLGVPTTNTARFTFTTPDDKNQSPRYLPWSFTRIHDLPHAILHYSIHIRNTSAPHPSPILTPTRPPPFSRGPAHSLSVPLSGLIPITFVHAPHL